MLPTVVLRVAAQAYAPVLRRCDIITRIGTKVIAALFDVTDALRSHQAGDTTTIAVEGADQTLEVRAILGERSS